MVLVGERKDSQTYVRNKKKACEEVRRWAANWMVWGVNWRCCGGSMHHRPTAHNSVALVAVQCMYCLPVQMYPPACLPLQVGIVSFGTDLPETASEEEVLKVRPLCCCCCH